MEVGAQLPGLLAWARAAQQAVDAPAEPPLVELAPAEDAALTVDQGVDQELVCNLATSDSMRAMCAQQAAQQEAADAIVLTQAAALQALRQRMASKSASVGACHGVVQVHICWSALPVQLVARMHASCTKEKGNLTYPSVSTTLLFVTRQPAGPPAAARGVLGPDL